MKSFVLAISVLLLAGCSSSKKKEATDAAAPTTPSASATSTESSAAQKTEKSGSMKKSTKASSSTSSASSNSVECNSGSDKRMLEIKMTDAKGCELHYTKMGNSQVVATQVMGDEYCVEVQNRIKGKLTAAGFTCPE